jgi:uncharacterized protein (DUF885 family)
MRLGIALALVFTWFVFSSALVAAEAEMNETEMLQTFFEEEWEYGLKENPIKATLFGDLRYNDRLGDSSIAAIERRQRHGVEALRQLESIDRSKLADSDKLNYDLYLENLTLRIEGHRFPWYLTPINQMGGVQQGPPNVVRSLPFRNAKHYEDYLSRLSQLPAVVDQTIERMQEGLKQRITPPKITLRAVAEQIQAQIVSKVEESPFYRPFKNFPETVPLSEQERLSAAGKEAIEQSILPAYQKLHDFWVSEYYPNTRETIGLSSLPNGEQWYAFGVKVSTTTNLLPKEIHEIGLREVKRIRAEMDKIIKGSGFEGTREEFFEFLRGDPQFYYSKPEHLLAGYRDICKRADAELPKLFGKFPRLPYGVREVPEYSAPSQTTAYYHGGSLKAGRPGWFYANTYKLETRPKWEMEALAIHEAVPGHHLQIALAQEIEGVPKFRKHGHYTAFVEGWGLYSESLGEEMGFYNDPYSKFGQLTYEMWRAIRLVVDTGMHAFGWDRQKAIDYFKANAGRHEHDITVEVDRYIVWPGQALAYKIGELKIKELRKFATKELGDRFDIRGFHDTVLGSGAVPLSILEQNVKNYVAAEIKKMTQGN